MTKVYFRDGLCTFDKHIRNVMRALGTQKIKSSQILFPPRISSTKFLHGIKAQTPGLTKWRVGTCSVLGHPIYLLKSYLYRTRTLQSLCFSHGPLWPLVGRGTQIKVSRRWHHSLPNVEWLLQVPRCANSAKTLVSFVRPSRPQTPDSVAFSLVVFPRHGNCVT